MIARRTRRWQKSLAREVRNVKNGTTRKSASRENASVVHTFLCQRCDKPFTTRGIRENCSTCMPEP